MLEICHASLLERFKIPEGGHRRIGSDPYPLGSSKVSSAKDGGCKSFEVDIYSLSQCDTLSNAVGGLCDLEHDSEMREGGSESESSYHLTKSVGRPLHHIKSASSVNLLQSESSSSSFENGIWNAMSSKTNEKVTTPTSEVLPANTSLSIQEGIAAAPLNLNYSTQHTLEQPSIPLSPSERIRNYKLDEFLFVMSQHGGCCIEAANENMNEIPLEVVARREIGTKEADDLRDDSSSTSFKRDKDGRPWFNSNTMKWEGFNEPDLAGFSSASDNENNEGRGEGDTTCHCPYLQQGLARRAMTPRRQEEIDFNSLSERDISELITSPQHDEDSCSSCSADRAVFSSRRRNDEMMGIVNNVPGCNELVVLRDNNHQKPFVTRQKSKPLTPRSSFDLPCGTRRKTCKLDFATKILFDACEEQHSQAMYRFLGPKIHAKEKMNDKERLLSTSGWRRLLFKGCQPHGQKRVTVVDRKGDKCSDGYHHHCTSSSKDGLELHSTQMGGGYWPSSTSTSSVGTYMFNGSDDDGSSGEQKKIIMPPRKHQSRRRFKCSKRGTGQHGRQRHVDPYHDCEGSYINCANCGKDNEMERREGEVEEEPKSNLKTRRKRELVGHYQGSDDVSCSSAASTVDHVCLSDEKNVKAITTKVHDAGGAMSRGINHHPIDDIEANPNPQNAFHRNAYSCNDLFTPSSANLQPSVGGITSASSSSNKGTNLDECHCHDVRVVELWIKTLCKRIALGKEKLDMVLGQN